MLRKESCRRCAGDMYRQSDLHGQFLNCLQCGAIVDLPPVPSIVGRIRLSAGAPRKTRVQTSMIEREAP